MKCKDCNFLDAELPSEKCEYCRVEDNISQKFEGAPTKMQDYFFNFDHGRLDWGYEEPPPKVKDAILEAIRDKRVQLTEAEEKCIVLFVNGHSIRDIAKTTTTYYSDVERDLKSAGKKLKRKVGE